MAGALPTAVLPPLTPLIPLNINNETGGGGYPLRNDNDTNFGYISKGNGTTYPEMYIPYRPANLSDPTLIQPGEKTFFKNVETNKWCRLAPFSPQTQCETFGMVCDQEQVTGASLITYTGLGLSYYGTPLVQEPGTGVLTLSSNPNCSEPNGDKFSFPPGESLAEGLVCQLIADGAPAYRRVAVYVKTQVMCQDACAPRALQLQPARVAPLPCWKTAAIRQHLITVCLPAHSSSATYPPSDTNQHQGQQRLPAAQRQQHQLWLHRQWQWHYAARAVHCLPRWQRGQPFTDQAW
jgi:hypothetical protein